MNLSVQQDVGCPTTAKVYEVGNPTAPSASSPGDTLIDGEHNASIKCSVKGNGPFQISGTVQGSSGEHEPVMVSVSGTINADKLTGTGSVNVYTPLLTGFASADGTCTFTVINQQVKPGSLWMTFKCPSITQPPGRSCLVGDSSAIVLENCDGS
ncbi:MAG: hypothetical protein WDO69_16755 [Pseudomonadota bacterium]